MGATVEAASEQAGAAGTPAAEATPSGGLPGLETEAVRAIAGIEELALIQLSRLPASYLAVGRLGRAESAASRSTLARQLIDFFRERRVTIYPALYAPEGWAALAAKLPRASWPERFSPAWDVLRQLEAKQQDGGEQPRQTRKWLLAVLKGHRAVIDALRGGELPGHVVLGLCATIARDVMELAFATRGEAFGDDYGSVGAFAPLAAEGPFAREDAYEYFELRALAEQAARHQRFLPEQTSGEIFDLGAAIDRTERLIDRLEGRARARYTSAEERLRQRRWRIAGITAAAVLLLLGIGLGVHSVWPLAPIADQTLVAKPGGIRGTYYHGEVFERRFFSRVDQSIDFDTDGAVDPRLEIDHFSIRWRGYIRFPEGGLQRLCSQSDDGARVRLAGELVVEDWSDHPARVACGKVRVRAGGWYPLEVEYYDASSRAFVRLLRGPDEQHLTPVGPADLCCRQ